MVSRRTNFGERSEPAPDRGGKLQSAGGRLKVTFRHCKYPNTKSNIHSSTAYNTFVTQLIRISRVCNDLSHFLVTLKDLYNTMVLKGCSKHKLIKKLYTVFIKKDLFKKFNIKKDVDIFKKSLGPYLKS